MAPMDLDLRLLFAVYGGPHGRWGPVMAALSLAGGGWATVALVPIIWHGRTRRLGGSLAIAIASQALLVWGLKLAIGRVRPWIALGLPQPFEAPHDPSFPSGHAAGCFCVAAFVALTLPSAWSGSPRLCRFVITLSAVLAVLVAFSRVYLGVHFPSDVTSGALLGAVVGAVGAKLHCRARALPPPAHYSYRAETRLRYRHISAKPIAVPDPTTSANSRENPPPSSPR